MRTEKPTRWLVVLCTLSFVLCSLCLVLYNLYSVFCTLSCDLGGILTHDLRNRNPMLYTAKLRGPELIFLPLFEEEKSYIVEEQKIIQAWGKPYVVAPRLYDECLKILFLKLRKIIPSRGLPYHTGQIP